jgi:hypothetical protein
VVHVVGGLGEVLDGVGLGDQFVEEELPPAVKLGVQGDVVLRA